METQKVFVADDGKWYNEHIFRIGKTYNWLYFRKWGGFKYFPRISWSDRFWVCGGFVGASLDIPKPTIPKVVVYYDKVSKWVWKMSYWPIIRAFVSHHPGIPKPKTPSWREKWTE